MLLKLVLSEEPSSRKTLPTKFKYAVLQPSAKGREMVKKKWSKRKCQSETIDDAD
jgi:hypothetical protein